MYGCADVAECGAEEGRLLLEGRDGLEEDGRQVLAAEPHEGLALPAVSGSHTHTRKKTKKTFLHTHTVSSQGSGLSHLVSTSRRAAIRSVARHTSPSNTCGGMQAWMDGWMDGEEEGTHGRTGSPCCSGSSSRSPAAPASTSAPQGCGHGHGHGCG